MPHPPGGVPELHVRIVRDNRIAPPYDFFMPTPHLDALGFVVADLARSLAFYRLLGLNVPIGAETEQHVEYTLTNGLRLMWDTAELIAGIDASWAQPSGGHRIALGFACDSPAEVDATYATATKAGYTGHLEPWDAFWGQRYATLHDPDGNAVDLFAPLDGTAEPA